MAGDQARGNRYIGNDARYKFNASQPAEVQDSPEPRRMHEVVKKTEGNRNESGRDSEKSLARDDEAGHEWGCGVKER